jgi:hypothetical protein
MSLTLSPLLRRFAERAPIPVMARAVLERCLDAEYLDGWFDRVSEKQYTRTLLFSAVFELMSQVVFRHQNSIHLAHQASAEEIGVSVTSVYNKLNGLEPGISRGLVGHVAAETAALIHALGAHAPLLAGYRVKILDGNALGARAHRLAETRGCAAAPLPGKSLAVLDPALGLIVDLFPCEDAYTQERALLAAVVTTVAAGELWIADRNFCTAGFLSALGTRGAVGLLREHEQVPFRPLEAMHERGRIPSGQVAEQAVEIPATATRPAQRLRRIRVWLDRPTRGGDERVYLLSTVPGEAADARALAVLYLKRWSIETAFHKMTTELRCEIDTLGYPGAALFGFAVAAVAYNLMAVVMAALRVAQGHDHVERSVSSYYLANEIANMAESLETVLDPDDWAVFATVTMPAFVAWLVETAGCAPLRKYRKHPRGPKKPTPQRHHDPRKPHVSVARLLAQRKAERAP